MLNEDQDYTEDYGIRICFAVLVHHRRDVVIDLLDNIRCYCPNSSIVLYNGGNDPDLCNGLGYPVCPTSRKLEYGVTAVYMLEIMQWLEEINHPYDVLINLDSDVLFARDGFEAYISSEMADKDYMGVGTKIPDEDFYCLMQLRPEIDRWKPLLGEEPYRESFNVGQAYSRRLVRRLLSFKKYDLLLTNLRETRAFGVDEIVFATITNRLGYVLHSYRDDVASTIRYRPHYPLDETIISLNKRADCFLIHPVFRNMKDETRAFIREAMKRSIQRNPDYSKRFVDGYLGEMPYFIRRNKFHGRTVEWLAASKDAGLLYWQAKMERKKTVLYGPYAFGHGRVSALSALESRFGNIEAVCRIGNRLVHYWRDEASGEWNDSEFFADGVRGMPAFLESGYGNFEVVVPLKDGGLGHWWRNNADPSLSWFGPEAFGEGVYDEVVLVENNSGQLTAVARNRDRYHYYVRDDRNSWIWFGPFD